MSGYQEIHILEANRLHSDDYKSNNNVNPAVWRNNIGDGFKINKGDEIELHSAYIGERGCSTLNAIELKNAKITKTKKEIKYTKIIKSLPQNITNQIEYNAKWNVSTETELIDQYDNKSSIVIGFYKNANLENCVFLPRNFVIDSGATITTTFTSNDKIEDGWRFAPPSNRCLSPQDYAYKTGYNYVRPVNDNSRFTALARNGEYWFLAITGSKLPTDHADPALYNYDYYREKVDINIDKGFNSAEDISKIITQQMQKIEKITNFYHQEVGKNIGNYELGTTTFYETPFLKYIYSGSSVWNHIVAGQHTQGTLNNNTLAFDNAYQFIYVKRPEFFLTGRTLPLMETYTAITKNSVSGFTYDQPIILNMLFTKNNLDLLNTYFKTQKLYENDFFNNTNFNYMYSDSNNNLISYARFLHINNPECLTQTTLGGDSYKNGDDTYPLGINNVNVSYPIFFYYDNNNEDKFVENPTITNMCYGFATKTLLGDNNYYITLNFKNDTIEKVGIPDDYFNASNVIPQQSKISHDKHFSAYGNLAMIGFSGYLNKQADGEDYGIIRRQDHNPVFDTSQYATHFYLGADQPALIYEGDHFKFTNLHTGEITGQIAVDAGAKDKTDTTQTADAPVYKINKRVSNVLYTPDARPYEEKTTIPAGSIVLMNKNIKPWAIFDSQSGVYIEDFGYDEENFKDGLWGILGFTYEQFNTTATEQINRIQRITDKNIYNLAFPTTNDEILSSSHRGFTLNQYNAVLHTMATPLSIANGTNTIYPAISEVSQSMKIISVNLPRKMLKPYYTVRSSIIPYTNYIGGINSNSLMPILAVISKINGEGDFYSETGSSMTFKVMKDFTLSELTTSIHDPDGSLSNVGLDSSILIKVIKNINQSLNIIDDIIQNEGKKN